MSESKNFTIDQIKAAHSKVKSGADFPNYVNDLIVMGVTSYETFVTDGHTIYYGQSGFSVTSDTKYPALTIAQTSNTSAFKNDLKAHQQGKSDYPTFCSQCALYGIEKWVVVMEDRSCTYYDLSGNVILTEDIPG